MPDMLVHLLRLPPLEPLLDELRGEGVLVRRVRPWEARQIRAFIERNFNPAWADEIAPGYARQPVSIMIAIREGAVVGFAAYECTCRGFFGPTGVAESERGRGVGRALLVACLWGMREMGYAYGIIGGVGPVEFYERAVGATVIPDSTPGIYVDGLRQDGPN